MLSSWAVVGLNPVRAHSSPLSARPKFVNFTFCFRSLPIPPLVFISMQLVPGEKVMGYDFLHEYRESQQRIVLRKADFSTGELSAIAVVRHEEPDVPYQRDDSFPGRRNIPL